MYLIYCFIIIAIPVILKIRKQIQQLQNDNMINVTSMNTYKTETDNKIQLLKVDVNVLEGKFYNLQNFYNKRLNGIYKSIFELKQKSFDAIKEASFDISS